MNIEEKSLGDAIRTVGPRLGHLHSCENDRGAPGSGHVPWTEVAEAVREIGYDDSAGDGEKQLAAYVVADGVTAAELRAHLHGLLPAHAVPAAFVVVDELPDEVIFVSADEAVASPVAATCGYDPFDHEVTCNLGTVPADTLLGHKTNTVEGHDLTVSEVIPALEKRTGSLWTLANIATLIGLLGTVVGIMRAFHDMSATGSAAPTVVASGVQSSAVTVSRGWM